MNFQLDQSETVSQGFQRVVLEQVDDLLIQLADPALPPDLVVHSTRKSLKRLRAVLRLARFAIGDEVYALERDRYRDIGRQLSEIRDSAVRIETIDDLIADAGPSHTYETLRGDLVDAHKTLSQELFEREHIFDKVAADLREGRALVHTWTDLPNDFSAIRLGLRKVYSRGRADFEAARTNPTTEQLHAWRKFTKHLWYQTQLLLQIHPDYLQPLATALDALADYLGKDHDLANQSAIVKDSGVGHALSARRARMQRRAIQLGKTVYREAPDELNARFEIYFRVWRGDLAPAAVAAFNPWPDPDPADDLADDEADAELAAASSPSAATPELRDAGRVDPS